MNIVALVGRLTRDVELKFGQSGKAYARFSLAVDRPFAKGEVDFINCVSFGKTAEIIEKYVLKGGKIAVEGNLRMNSYESNGEKRTTYEVYVNNVTLLESKNNNNENQTPQKENSASKTPVINNVNIEDGFTEDEFPF